MWFASIGERFQIYALVAGRNLDVLCSQILEFRPKSSVWPMMTTLDSACGHA